LQGYFGEVPERIYIDCFSVAKSISQEALDQIMKGFSKEELNEMTEQMYTKKVQDEKSVIGNRRRPVPLSDRGIRSTRKSNRLSMNGESS